MAAHQKSKPQAKPKLFHATMLVTRSEEWWVEARNVQEAEALLASGQGHRATVGACVSVELEGMTDGDA